MTENELILNEVKENRLKFRVDHFDIIIAEYIGKYGRGHLKLNPPYQRMFRWTLEDQSTLIESIILGVPLPPFFVFQNDNGLWELIDGVQRTTTIINFISENSFTLRDLEVLKGLNGKKFQELPTSIKLKIENFRIRIETVEESNDIFSQYLLFSRLNSNGEKLEAQEKRNFLIYKKNPDFYGKIQELAMNSDYLNTIYWEEESPKEKKKESEEEIEKTKREKKIEKQENVEYVIKFFLARYIVNFKKETKEYKNISSLIDEQIINYLDEVTEEQLEREYEIFVETFKFLYRTIGDLTLKKNNKKINNIANRFTVTCGVSFMANKEGMTKLELLKSIDEYYYNQEFIKLSNSSQSPTKRIFELNKLSFNFFNGDR